MAETAPAQALKSVGHRERRRKSRKSAEDLCLVTVEMEPAGFGLMLDVSEGGVGVQVMNRIEPGTDVLIAFKVPDVPARIEGSGVVTWYDGEGRVGIRFQQLKDQSGKDLQRWIDSLPESTVHEPLEVVPRRTQPVLREQVRAIQAQIAASHLDVDLVLQFLVERVVELTHSNGGAIALGQGDDMVCRASTGLAPDVGVKIGSGSALTTECLRTRKIVRCDDTETDSRVDRDICRELNLRSSLILPILVSGEVRGVLEVFSPLPKAFGQQHLALLQQLVEFTSQIVYGAVPADATEIESSAKSQAKPDHTALSALLTATTKAAENTPAPKLTVAPPVTAPKLVPPVTSTVGAAETKAVVAAPAAAPKSGRIKKKEKVEPAPINVVEPVPDLDPVADTDGLLDSEEASNSKGSRVAVYVGVFVLLLALAGSGWWYRFGRNQPTQPSTASSTPAVQQPTPSVPVTPPTATATTAKPAANGQSLQSKPAQQPMVAADTVRSPRAAIVEADPSTPLVIAPGNKPASKPDTSITEVPSVSIAAGGNLSGMNLPGNTSRPQLQQSQGVVSGGRVVQRVEPVYPLFAMQQRIQGDVVLSARVLKDGSLENIKRVSGNPILGPAAVAAVRQWKYEPFKLNGQAQDVDISVTVQFRIKQ